MGNNHALSSVIAPSHDGHLDEHSQGQRNPFLLLLYDIGIDVGGVSRDKSIVELQGCSPRSFGSSMVSGVESTNEGEEVGTVQRLTLTAIRQPEEDMTIDSPKYCECDD